MKQITNIRKAVCVMANQLKKRKRPYQCADTGRGRVTQKPSHKPDTDTILPYPATKRKDI